MLIKRIEDMIDVIKSKLGEVTEEETVGESASTGIKGVNKSFRLTNKDNEKFLFKPESGEHTSKWRYVPPHTQYKRERAAYLVSMALGWNLVPDTKIISYKDEIGSLQDWVTDVTKSDKTLSVYSPKYIWEAGLFDIIIGNIDRHSGNWMTKGHKPILIDHGYSFPVQAAEGDSRSIILSRFAYHIWGEKIPSSFLEDMQELGEPSIQEHIKILTGDNAFELFNERADELIDSGIAEVSKYICVEKIKGIPPEK